MSAGPLAVVTGASGFVGSHIVDELLRNGARVRCILRPKSSTRWLDGKPIEIVRLEEMDLEGLSRAVAGASWVVHAAGITQAKSPKEFHEINVGGTERMLRAAMTSNGTLQRFLYISSQAAGGPAAERRPVLEGDRADIKLLRVGTEEQYRTTNLVTGLPRVITVSISSRLPSSYVAALDQALARYNALGLRITFQRVSSGAAISIVKGNGSYLASSGFPSGGNPYNQVKVNSNAIGSQPQATVATILAHELGHCIGFRHTDYMNRAYSCGGQAVNEGASTVGAILIPGTPSGPDPNSWMLACIGSGQDRPFNTNDQTALNYLYK